MHEASLPGAVADGFQDVARRKGAPKTAFAMADDI